MAGILSDSVSADRFSALLMAVLGGLALVLALIGVYAVVSFVVSRRQAEFAVRIVFGAPMGEIVRMVLVEGGGLVVAGLVLGAMGAWSLSHAVSSQLYGVAPGDPYILTTVGLVLAAFVMLAHYLPARRASRTDPVVALRQE